jgi:hypothetical protein
MGSPRAGTPLNRNALIDAFHDSALTGARTVVPPGLAAGAFASGTLFNAGATMATGHWPTALAMGGSIAAGGVIGKWGLGVTDALGTRLSSLPAWSRLPTVRAIGWDVYLSAAGGNALTVTTASVAGGLLNTLGPAAKAAVDAAKTAGRGYWGQAAAAYKSIGPTVALLGVAAGATARPELAAQILGVAATGVWALSRTPTRLGIGLRSALNTNVVSPSSGGLAPLRGQRGSIGVLSDMLAKASRIEGDKHPNQLRYIMDNGTSVLFRKDFGNDNHDVNGPYRGQGPIDHYNIEVQVPGTRGVKKVENLHMVPDGQGSYVIWGIDGKVRR